MALVQPDDCYQGRYIEFLLSFQAKRSEKKERSDAASSKECAAFRAGFATILFRSSQFSTYSSL